MSNQAAFLNRLRSLFNIDADQIPELTNRRLFLANPVEYLIRAGDAQSDAIWREIEKRQLRATAPVDAERVPAKGGLSDWVRMIAVQAAKSALIALLFTVTWSVMDHLLGHVPTSPAIVFSVCWGGAFLGTRA
ncbi:MAG: hypothetical protein JWO51_173 [Rhodospirillales bacterium]|nr:hypothetical protein [Rhodospirillales bacterium]